MSNTIKTQPHLFTKHPFTMQWGFSLKNISWRISDFIKKKKKIFEMKILIDFFYFDMSIWWVFYYKS